MLKSIVYLGGGGVREHSMEGRGLRQYARDMFRRGRTDSMQGPFLTYWLSEGLRKYAREREGLRHYAKVRED